MVDFFLRKHVDNNCDLSEQDKLACPHQRPQETAPWKKIECTSYVMGKYIRQYIKTVLKDENIPHLHR